MIYIYWALLALTSGVAISSVSGMVWANVIAFQERKNREQACEQSKQWEKEVDRMSEMLRNAGINPYPHHTAGGFMMPMPTGSTPVNDQSEIVSKRGDRKVLERESGCIYVGVTEYNQVEMTLNAHHAWPSVDMTHDEVQELVAALTEVSLSSRGH